MSDIKKIQLINQSESITSFSLRAAIIITSKTRVLLVRNEGKTKYKHVGGHIKFTESVIQGLKREILEEIGELNFKYPGKPLFFDKVCINGDLMINSYFGVIVSEKKLDNISNNSFLPTKIFNHKQLNSDVTFNSEIRSLKYFLARKNF